MNIETTLGALLDNNGNLYPYVWLNLETGEFKGYKNEGSAFRCADKNGGSSFLVNDAMDYGFIVIID